MNPVSLAPAFVPDSVRQLLSLPLATNTSRAYAADWKDFAAWCAGQGHESLPAEPLTVVTYVAGLTATLGIASIERRLAAIAWQHRSQSLESPTGRLLVRQALRGLRRHHGRPPRGKDPLLPADLVRLLATIPDTLTGLRDRALLLTGFMGAFRRSELAALDVADLEFTAEGVAIRINRSKTDQEGRGRKVGLPANPIHGGTHCPARALERWMAAAAISGGPVFRRMDRYGRPRMERLSGQGVNIVLKRYAAIAGMKTDQIGAHSLRIGLVTAAARAGKSERQIMAQTGHKSLCTLRRYIREAGLFQENAAEGLL